MRVMTIVGSAGTGKTTMAEVFAAAMEKRDNAPVGTKTHLFSYSAIPPAARTEEFWQGLKGVAVVDETPNEQVKSLRSFLNRIKNSDLTVLIIRAA